MGLIDKLRGFIIGSSNTPIVHKDDKNKKSELAADIVNLVDKINKINCFAGANLRGLTTNLEQKSLEELQQLHTSLSNKYEGLIQQRNLNNAKNQSAIAARWTGQRAPEQTNHDLDFSQRGD